MELFGGRSGEAAAPFSFPFLPRGGGVGGGAEKKTKENGAGLPHKTGVEASACVSCACWNGRRVRPRRNHSPMRTQKVRITTRSARETSVVLKVGSSLVQ